MSSSLDLSDKELKDALLVYDMNREIAAVKRHSLVDGHLTDLTELNEQSETSKVTRNISMIVPLSNVTGSQLSDEDQH